MTKYLVTKRVVVAYYYNIEATSEKMAIERAENRTQEDWYQWEDSISINAKLQAPAGQHTQNVDIREMR